MRGSAAAVGAELAAMLESLQRCVTDYFGIRDSYDRRCTDLSRQIDETNALIDAIVDRIEQWRADVDP